MWEKSFPSECEKDPRERLTSRSTATRPMCLLREDVGGVKEYKYPQPLQYRLNWSGSTQRQYTRRGSAFLRKLRSFSFSSRMMESFYQSAVAGAVYLAAVCWENSSRAGNTNRMNKLIRKSSSVTGCKLDFQWRRGMCVCSVVLASLLDRITRMFSTTKRRSSFYTSQQPSWTGIAVNT